MTDVLIVDDDEPIRTALCLLLDDAGFVCQQAANGADALCLLRASTEALVVLLDLMMPRLSGQEVLAAVAADSQLAGHHAFILLTAASTTLSLALVHLLHQLDVPVIGKPFDIEQLVETVRRAADRLAQDRPPPAACRPPHGTGDEEERAVERREGRPG